MDCPFPGMDPWLEHPALWPDVHNSLVAGLREALVPLVAPRYFVALERRTYLLAPEELVIGRPDVSVAVAEAPRSRSGPSSSGTGEGLDVELLIEEEIGETFLEIRDVETSVVVTVFELLSPANKIHARGRQEYEEKRRRVLSSRTHLIELDLLRAGRSIPLVSPAPQSDYRLLVSRAPRRPKATLMAWNLREPIPSVRIPLAHGEDEPELGINEVVHDIYRRARFDLRLRYDRPPEPTLSPDDLQWASELVDRARARA